MAVFSNNLGGYLTPFKTLNRFLETTSAEIWQWDGEGESRSIAFDDEGVDGYWLYCAKGYNFVDMDSHTAHEYTIKDLISVAKNIIEVDEEN